MDIHALSDGRVVVIRPIRVDDVARLQAAHGRLSSLTRYRRFMTAKPYLSTADATYLSAIDGCDHYALVVTVAEGPGVEDAIIAVVPSALPPGRCAGCVAATPSRSSWTCPPGRRRPRPRRRPRLLLRSSPGALEADRTRRPQGEAILV